MKIICIGRNYRDHIKELDSEENQEPVFFLKPESALLRNKKDFFIPYFSDDIHYEVELVLKIHKTGKHIEKKFAHRYYNEASVGIDFTARDIQNRCKQKGLPWEISKAFDYSAAVGDFIPVNNNDDPQSFDFRLDLNNNTVQKANASEMIFSINEIISYLSQFMTLKIGDIIFTGTPAGVGKIAIGDELSAYLNDNKLLNIKIK